MGFLFFNGPPLPELRPDPVANPEAQPIQLQFPPEGLTISAGAVWESINSAGRDNPILQFVRGGQRTISFETKLWAETTVDSIDNQIDLLLASQVRNFIRKRPYVWTFVWGQLFETVVIESVSDIRYDEIRPDGSARGVLLTITLLKYEPFDIKLTDPSAPLPSTFYTYSKEGDTWEQIAFREYGDAILGDLLRRRNPDLPTPGDEPGRVLALPPVDQLRDEEIAPVSSPLKRTTAGLARRQEIYEARSTARSSTIVKVA